MPQTVYVILLLPSNQFCNLKCQSPLGEFIRRHPLWVPERFPPPPDRKSLPLTPREQQLWGQPCSSSFVSQQLELGSACGRCLVDGIWRRWAHKVSVRWRPLPLQEVPAILLLVSEKLTGCISAGVWRRVWIGIHQDRNCLCVSLLSKKLSKGTLPSCSCEKTRKVVFLYPLLGNEILRHISSCRADFFVFI